MENENKEMHIDQENQNDPLNNSQAETSKDLPLIPVKSMNLFPGMILHFDLNGSKSLKALEYCMQADQLAFLSEQKDIGVNAPYRYDIYSVGCIAKVKQVLKLHHQHSLMQ